MTHPSDERLIEPSYLEVCVHPRARAALAGLLRRYADEVVRPAFGSAVAQAHILAAEGAFDGRHEEVPPPSVGGTSPAV